MPVGANGKFFEDDFQKALDEFHSGSINPMDKLPQGFDNNEISPDTREELQFDPELKSLYQEVSSTKPVIDTPTDQSRLEGSFNAVDYSNKQTFNKYLDNEPKVKGNKADLEDRRSAPNTIDWAGIAEGIKQQVIGSTIIPGGQEGSALSKQLGSDDIDRVVNEIKKQHQLRASSAGGMYRGKDAHPDGPMLEAIQKLPTLPSFNNVTKFSEGDTPERTLMGVLTGSDGPRYQTWPERHIRETASGILNAVKKLGSGEIDPSSREGVEEVTKLTSALVFGPGAPAALGIKLADGSLGSFAGVGAKTLDTVKLNKANKLLDEGANPDKIWKETGFYKAEDGRWRWEIPEPPVSAVKPLKDWKESQTLGDVLDHPELYKAYPEIKNFPVELKDLGRHYAAVNNVSMKINKNKIADEDVAMRVMTHEIQHIIQRQEQRPSTGSNPELAGDLAEAALRRRMAAPDVKLGSEEHKIMSDLLRDINKNKKAFSEWLYEHNPGEVEANLAMRRYETQNYSESPLALQQYLEYKGLSKKPVSIPEIETARLNRPIPELMADKVPLPYRTANDNTPINSADKAWIQYAQKHNIDIKTDTRDDFIKAYDKLTNFRENVLFAKYPKNYTEINVAKYNKMAKEADPDWKPIKYDPDPLGAGKK